MKDLKYYKDNCKEDYLHTPISVLRYITELEKVALFSVSKRCFCGAEYDGVECNSCGFDASEVDIY